MHDGSQTFTLQHMQPRPQQLLAMYGIPALWTATAGGTVKLLRLAHSSHQENQGDEPLEDPDEGTLEAPPNPLDDPADSLLEGSMLEGDGQTIQPDHTCSEAFSSGADYLDALSLRYREGYSVYDWDYEPCEACIWEAKSLAESDTKPEASALQLGTGEAPPEPYSGYESCRLAVEAHQALDSFRSPTMPPPPQPRLSGLRESDDKSPDYAFQSSPAYT
ncbi:uncharacterized protein BDZ99DRAFT_565873 [Mytilinidion resinicola]|uniref:Uncharacterized protein n=1 Tax=Mytilinidion resinicola TaxID=574789 RepID=A0A6A6Z6T9_9PEZI|nr:uncharacterized protein BDZ99DRAFT_565873 [Mytilinidion resinicola]KAF2815987.1 hypothetical protein BDZ99DRAFT_565873 [Mytilinidion resinicola]